jgi:HK97 family phage major capsid protein
LATELERLGKSRVGRGLEKLLVQGTDQAGTVDVNNTGILNLAQVATTTTALANGVEWGDLISLYDALDSAYLPNAAWFMSSKVRNTLLKTMSGLGLPFFTPAPTLGAFDLLLGRPIVITQSLVQNLTTANSLPILFGDLSSALAVVDTPLISQLSTERYAERNLVLLQLFVRCGSTDMVPAALQGLKLAAA